MIFNPKLKQMFNLYNDSQFMILNWYKKNRVHKHADSFNIGMLVYILIYVLIYIGQFTFD